jgi:hypothetical protein
MLAAYCGCEGMVSVRDWSRAASIRLRGWAKGASRATGLPRRVMTSVARFDPGDEFAQMCLGVWQADCVHVALLTQ